MMKKSIGIIFLVFFLGCISKKEDRIDYEISISPEQLKTAENMAWGILFDSLEVIKTPDVENLPLWRIQRIIQANEYIAILTFEELIVINRKDTSTYIYRHLGRGSGEYQDLQDVVFDKKSNHLLLLTGFPNQVLTVDLECNYLSSYTLPASSMWERLYFHQEDLYILGYRSVPEKKELWDIVSKYTDAGFVDYSVVGKRLLFGSSADYWSIGETGNDLLIGIKSRDSLFQVNSALQVSPVKLVFISGGKVLAGHHQQMLFMDGKKALFTNSLPRGKWANFEHYFLYNCQDKATCVYLNINDLGTYVGFDSENLYYLVFPEDASRLRENGWKTWEEYKKVYKPLFHILQDMDENDNPIILRYHVLQ